MAGQMTRRSGAGYGKCHHRHHHIRAAWLFLFVEQRTQLKLVWDLELFVHFCVQPVALAEKAEAQRGKSV